MLILSWYFFSMQPHLVIHAPGVTENYRPSSHFMKTKLKVCLEKHRQLQTIAFATQLSIHSHCKLFTLFDKQVHLKKVDLPYSKLRAVTSIDLNSTLQPMVEFGGGGLKRMLCQFVDCIF